MRCVAGRQGTELALISRQEWQELVDCNEMQEDGTVIEVDKDGDKSSLGRKITAIDELPDEWFLAVCDYLGLLIDRFGEKVRNQYQARHWQTGRQNNNDNTKTSKHRQTSTTPAMLMKSERASKIQKQFCSSITLMTQ